MAGALVVLLVAPRVIAAAGSWSGELPGLRIAAPDRLYWSDPVSAPDSAPVDGGRVSRVSWRFELPPGRGIEAWLCGGERCVALQRQRGASTALAGAPAGGPFRFRFALPAGERRALSVRGLRLGVDYFPAPIAEITAGKGVYLADGFAPEAE
nr:flagellar protein FlhE [Parahaliea mediterranea]